MTRRSDDESQDRLGEALRRLDPRSRRLAELWLAGLGRREIAAEMRVRDEVVAAIGARAFRQLRRLLHGDSCPERPEEPADGEPEADRGPDGAGVAMTHMRTSPTCPGECPE